MSQDHTATSINLTPSPEILEVIAEVDLQIHHCLAELIDNGLDELKSVRSVDETLEPRIDIRVPTSGRISRDSSIRVGDNGRGMSVDQLERALRAGSSGKQMHGTLGMFGMGFNIATARLGSLTEVHTGRVGDDEWVIATIDLRQMIESDSYVVPLRFEPKDPAEHGTSVTVTRLKDDTVQKLSSGRAIRDIRTRLGRIYTYMVRDPQSGYSGAELLGGEGLSLYVNDTEVKPYIPCVWDPSRTVSYKGSEVHAATKIDIPLKDAYACMDCGKWHSISHDVCSSCGGAGIERRERRIWGWIGVQRYTDNNDFGFSFFRHGRCLVDTDHSLFEWESPDGHREKEYPVELGRGRIVGEIHLDHAKPQVRKTDFDRQSQDWLFMVESVRGAGPLRPNIAKSRGYPENTSVLGRYFNAFRRNDPGVASLVPGNGTAAIHEQAKEWAGSFRDGDPDYLTDEKWFEAAERHDQIKSGRSTDQPEIDTENEDDDWLKREGLGDLSDGQVTVDGVDDDRPETPDDDQRAPETDEERFARYRASAVLLPESAKEVRVGAAKTTFRVYATHEVDLMHEGRKRQFAIRSVAGEIEIYVDENASLVSEFGWSLMDTALVCAAPDLRDLYGYDGAVDELIRDILEQYPDRRIDGSSVRERAEAILEGMQERLVEVVASDPAAYWDALSAEARRAAENAAVEVASDINWTTCVDNGDFARFVDSHAVLDLLAERPDLVLDGNLFRATYATLGEGTRADQAARIVALVADLRRMLSGVQRHKTIELRRFLLSADLLEAEVVTS